MKRLIVTGNKRLSGEVDISGAKNSALPILAATVVINGVSVIKNCPDISDIDASLQILSHLGCKVKRNGNTVTVDSSGLNRFDIPNELMGRMRSSVIFTGALLSRTGKAEISAPGGCAIGKRPIDLHISAFKDLGASVKEENGKLFISSKNTLNGSVINLRISSVGATENIILAAICAKGTTVIENAAKEPEIVDLCEFLTKAGANIKGAGTSRVTVIGTGALKGASHTVMPDRIEAATFIGFAAITAGNLKINNVIPAHLRAVISAYKTMGVEFYETENSITVMPPKCLKRAAYLKSSVYPLFPTDAGPIIVAVMSVANGTSVYRETVFENRFKYINGLNSLGANIKTEDNTAIIEGVNRFKGGECRCTDLRGGAALLAAALNANGTTYINNAELIGRGYEKIEEKLRCVGAQIYSEDV